MAAQTVKRRSTFPLVLLAGVFVAAQAGYAIAQKTVPQKKPVYDQYEPSKVRRTRSQECMRDEESAGAYCVKVCRKGYLPVPNSNPPLCRSVEPLPPGQLPGPIRKETGTLPKAPKPDKAGPPPSGF